MGKDINPILLKGEIGIEIDTNKIKIGDGVKTWTQLDYVNSSASFIVVKNFNDLPEEGVDDKLYKVSSSQLLYIWNSLTNTYAPLGLFKTLRNIMEVMLLIMVMKIVLKNWLMALLLNIMNLRVGLLIYLLQLPVLRNIMLNLFLQDILMKLGKKL